MGRDGDANERGLGRRWPICPSLDRRGHAVDLDAEDRSDCKFSICTVPARLLLLYFVNFFFFFAFITMHPTSFIPCFHPSISTSPLLAHVVIQISSPAGIREYRLFNFFFLPLLSSSSATRGPPPATHPPTSPTLNLTPGAKKSSVGLRNVSRPH